MNHGVAADAWRRAIRTCALTMYRTRPNRTVALVAQRGNARHIQQPGVLRSMRSVATHAAFRPHRGVLKDERSARFHVALGADSVLICSRLQVALSECAVRIVAIRAGHHAFVHLVVEGHAELRLLIVMASEAEIRLCCLEQRGLLLALVNAVAADATHVRLGVRRAIEVGMLARVAAQAALIQCLRACLGGIEDLRHISAAVHVLFARAMAVLARNAALAVHERHFGVRVLCKSLGDFFMAGNAGLGSN